ncbi:MAG: hypothetical protein IKK92_04705 [Prevotella sp.]|nr:hypothetical protein [Prevotella sp.]
MRNNKDPNSVCDSCGDERKNTLEMFDLCIGTTIVTICDVCNEQILKKTLAGECNKNARIKTPQDMKVMRKRAQNSPHARLMEQRERERQEAEKIYHGGGK